jgi:hypothetical protein
LKSNTTHITSNQTGSPVQPAAHPLLIFFPSSAGFRGVPVHWHSILFIHFLLVACHIEPTHSTLSPHRVQSMPNPNNCTTSQLLYPYADPLELYALLVEQPVLYRFTSLHCMSPVIYMRSCHPSRHSFLNCPSRLLTCAVTTPYLSPISLHLRGRSFMSSAYPPSTQPAYSQSARSSSGPDAVSCLCHSVA